jgi:hypothetical protein
MKAAMVRLRSEDGGAAALVLGATRMRRKRKMADGRWIV